MADRHGPRRLTVADVGDNEIRVIDVDRHGKSLSFPGALLIPNESTQNPFENPDFCKAMAESARNTPYVSMIYGGEDTVVRLMNFPGTPGREDAVAAQVRQTLGVGSEYLVLCRIIKQSDKQYTVLAAAMPEAPIKHFREELQRLGLTPVSLVHRGIALANLTEKVKSVIDPEGNTGILYADVNSSVLVLRINKETVLIRQLKEGLDAVFKSVMEGFGLDRETAIKLFNSGSFDVSSQGSPYIANWIHQVELSLDFIERRMGGRIRKLFLCGSSLGINILRVIFEAETKRPTEVLPQLPGFACPTQNGKLAEGQRPVSPYLLGACEALRVTFSGGGQADEI